MLSPKRNHTSPPRRPKLDAQDTDHGVCHHVLAVTADVIQCMRVLTCDGLDDTLIRYNDCPCRLCQKI